MTKSNLGIGGRSKGRRSKRAAPHGRVEQTKSGIGGNLVELADYKSARELAFVSDAQPIAASDGKVDVSA